MNLAIKKEFQDNFVGFKSANGRKLGELDQEALSELLLIAKQSNDKSLLNLFEDSPISISSLQQAETNKKIASLKTKYKLKL